MKGLFVITDFSEDDFVKWDYESKSFEFDARLQLPIVNVKQHVFKIGNKFAKINCTRQLTTSEEECPACDIYIRNFREYREFKPVEKAYVNAALVGENRFKILPLTKSLYSRILTLILNYKVKGRSLYNSCLIPQDRNPMRLGFLSSIFNENKEESLVSKLVYADWLEENGEFLLSEAVRLTTLKPTLKREKREKRSRFRKICNELKFDTTFLNLFNGATLKFSRTMSEYLFYGSRPNFPFYEAQIVNLRPCLFDDFDKILKWEPYDLSALVLPGNKDEIEKLVNMVL